MVYDWLDVLPCLHQYCTCSLFSCKINTSYMLKILEIIWSQKIKKRKVKNSLKRLTKLKNSKKA